MSMNDTSTLYSREGLWTRRYINLAKEIATWSKDPRTKVGAVVVGKEGQILSQGYNGFPRGIEDREERLNDREQKYRYVVHARSPSSIRSTFRLLTRTVRHEVHPPLHRNHC